MTVAYIAAGAAGTICGNCIKDNALAAALIRQGQDVVLLPSYTPLLTDDADVSDARIVLGGVNLYLQGKYRLFRSTGALDWLLDHPGLLKWASGFAVDTDPANLGQMTRDMFEGTAGPHRREVEKLVRMLSDIRPELVHLTNSLLTSVVEPVKRTLGVPVVCSLQGDADFLHGLPEPFRSDCYGLLRQHAAHVDCFVASCENQARAMAPILGRSADRIDTILPGVSIDGFGDSARSDDGRFVVGFLARIAPEKGLELLADAVDRLRSRHPDRTIELRVAGWRAEATEDYIANLRAKHAFEDVGYLTRPEKIDFLAGLDAFSVPTTYHASKGLYVLEALASGVPVVQPRIGVFPELIAATEGGQLCEPNDAEDLAAKLEAVLMGSGPDARQIDEARKRVEADFNADRMAADTVALYERVSGGEGP